MPPGNEPRPLRDAELVLLIDDDQPEIGDGFVLVEKGVRADENLRLPKVRVTLLEERLVEITGRGY